MKTTEKTIAINAPVDIVYATWANYSSFPAFTRHVVKVEKVTRKRSRWILDVLGYGIEFEAELDELRPNKFISWHSVSGVKHFGYAHFASSEGGTLVTARLMFETDNLADVLIEDLDIAWDEFEAAFEESLNDFKNYVEQMWWNVPAVV